MIIKTAPNGHAGRLFNHLTRMDDGNERIRLVDIRGCVSDELLGSLREMKATAAGSRCEQSLYHVSFAATIEDASRMQGDTNWLRCAERFEEEFGLQNHARAVVHHFKEGRWHQHVVWNRIDPETGRAVHLSHERRRAIKVARALEQELKLDRVSSDRPEHRKDQRPPLQWEKEAARRTKIDAGLVRDQIFKTWNSTNTGTDFAAALDASGLILAKGDNRPFVVLDELGNFFALGSRVLPGERTRSITAKLGEIREQLPSIDEARELILARERSKRVRREGNGDAGKPGSMQDPLTERYRAAHVKLKKKQAEEAAALEKQKRLAEKRQPAALKKFDKSKPKIGLIDKVTLRAKRKEMAWERKRAEFIKQQKKEMALLEHRAVELERHYKREADQLRGEEKKERALRKAFELRAKKAEREQRPIQEPVQEQTRSRGMRLRLTPDHN